MLRTSSPGRGRGGSIVVPGYVTKETLFVKCTCKNTVQYCIDKIYFALQCLRTPVSPKGRGGVYLGRPKYIVKKN
jgi:hypothetical protein